jgi:hypothetical protein
MTKDKIFIKIISNLNQINEEIKRFYFFGIFPLNLLVERAFKCKLCRSWQPREHRWQY